MNNSKKNILNIKTKALSLSDNNSPLLRFINARNNIRYMNDKTCKTISNLNNLNNINNNNIINQNKSKEQQIKKYKLKANSVKLLKDQLLIISHFCKRNVPNDINYEYSNSLLNTFGNRNFFRRKREKMNIDNFTQFSSNYYFYKTSDIRKYDKKNHIKKRIEKLSYDNKNILPKINIILKKNTKS